MGTFEDMKTNPYKLVERIVVSLVLAAVATMFCVIITAMQWWKGVGWVALVVAVYVVGYIVVEEWNQRKAQWDLAHKPQQLDAIELEPEKPPQ